MAAWRRMLAMTESVVIHVAAGAIVDVAGRVAVALRPEAAHQGGLWEFPGGKLEPGEQPYEALRRELREELGIELRRARPLLRVTHHYGDRSVLLDVWKVEAFDGEPHGREGQPLRWLSVDDLPGLEMPAADRPIVNALRLPDRYLITGEFQNREDFLQRLRCALHDGIRLVQLRLPHVQGESYQGVARLALQECHRFGARMLLNSAPETVGEIGADGVHLNGTRLMECKQRPLPTGQWVAASCHNAAELRHAASIGVDFAVLSPVQPTESHPGAPILGWERARQLLDEATVPVYLLGGLDTGDLAQAWDCGAQGVAAIRAYWGERGP